jgi:hypothetical protein
MQQGEGAVVTDGGVVGRHILGALERGERLLVTTCAAQRPPELPKAARVVGPRPNQPAQDRDRFLEAAGRGPERTEVGERVHVLGLDRDRTPPGAFGLLDVAALAVHGAHAVVGVGIVRPGDKRPLETGEGLVPLACRLQRDAEGVGAVGGRGLQGRGALQAADRLARLAELLVGDAGIVPGAGVGRICLEDRLILGQRAAGVAGTMLLDRRGEARRHGRRAAPVRSGR